MTTMRDVLGKKRPEVWSIRSDATAYEALERMAEKDVGALPVVDDGRLVGVFSERDYARKVILKGKTSRDTRVADLMSAPAVHVGPEHSLEGCMELMTERRVRHLPVVDEGRLVGIVTIGDVVKWIICEQGETIEHLAEYIRSEPPALCNDEPAAGPRKVAEGFGAEGLGLGGPGDPGPGAASSGTHG